MICETLQAFVFGAEPASSTGFRDVQTNARTRTRLGGLAIAMFDAANSGLQLRRVIGCGPRRRAPRRRNGNAVFIEERAELANIGPCMAGGFCNQAGIVAQPYRWPLPAGAAARFRFGRGGCQSQLTLQAQGADFLPEVLSVNLLQQPFVKIGCRGNRDQSRHRQTFPKLSRPRAGAQARECPGQMSDWQFPN